MLTLTKKKLFEWKTKNDKKFGSENSKIPKMVKFQKKTES